MIPRDRLLTAQDQAGLHRLFTQMVGKHLIHADPTLERRPFLQRSTGKQVSRLPGMNAHPSSVLVEKARDDIHLSPVWSKRFETFSQDHPLLALLGPEVVLVHTIGHEQGRKPFGVGGSFLSRQVGFLTKDGNRFHPGK